jgi:hypothetical protein
MQGPILSRRAVLAGALLAATGFAPPAHAAESVPGALLVVYLHGGYHSLFSSADSLNGQAGINNDFVTLGNGLAIDKTLGSGPNKLPKYALDHMASIGVRHGESFHAGALAALNDYQGTSGAVRLAAALGGGASIKAAMVGQPQSAFVISKKAQGSVSLQTILDMKKTLDALGATPAGPTTPERDVAAMGIARALEMSRGGLARAPNALSSLGDGYGTAVDTLRKPVQPFGFAELASAYGLGNTTAVTDFKSRMAAAELMIRTGTNVVYANDWSWDMHSDPPGTVARNMMNARILPALNVFLNRMVSGGTGRNVTVCIMGEFSRQMPVGTDHAPNLTATVIGPHVKQGTSGRTDRSGFLPAGTPSGGGLWSYLAAVTKAASNPFGEVPTVHAPWVLAR